MYFKCKNCGNEAFRITLDFKIECANCGEILELHVRRPERPRPEPKPKPFSPDEVKPFWFKK
jgi:DNA-directed RNA polymerase subunit RPC12/RpoP